MSKTAITSPELAPFGKLNNAALRYAFGVTGSTRR
jgi:hypothetical protein